MPSLATWLSEQDQLGSRVEIGYKGKVGYGTVCGGFISLTLTLFTFSFTAIQMFGFFFAPQYNYSSYASYATELNGEPDEGHSIWAADFFPAFVIESQTVVMSDGS